MQMPCHVSPVNSVAEKTTPSYHCCHPYHAYRLSTGGASYCPALHRPYRRSELTSVLEETD